MPLYDTLGDSAVEFIINHAGVRMVSWREAPVQQACSTPHKFTHSLHLFLSLSHAHTLLLSFSFSLTHTLSFTWLRAFVQVITSGSKLPSLVKALKVWQMDGLLQGG